MLDLGDIFGEGGPLERALPDFRVRRGQLRMAQRVAAALAARETLVVEAGTGTGKTFAYLVPALLSGARVLISTGTRTLQDQLYSRDLPLVGAALGRPVQVALLKGRANYLCRQRLTASGEASPVQTEMIGGEASPAQGSRAMLTRIARWAATTRSGDLAEVRGLSDAHPVWSQITSTRESCLGARCPEITRCHVALARRAALDADIVIVNHHLLLADLALKEDGFGDLLGSADAVILDEAHQIPDLATQFFGASVSSRQLESFLKDAQLELRKGLAVGAAGPGEVSVTVLAACLRDIAEGLNALRAAGPAGSAAATTRLPWTERQRALEAAAEQLSQRLTDLEAALAPCADDAALARIAGRAGELASALTRIAAVDELEGARSLEITPRGITLSLMPFDISARFRALIEARRGAWIFTSATLSLGDEFGHFTGRLGIGECPTLTIESPFDHERQSLLYLPQSMPQPSSPEFVAAVIDTALPLIDAAAGGAFVLFTSHRALAQGAALLRARWAESAPYRLFVQGEAPRERLLQEFRDDGNGVLLGTASFWEGVDVKGEALRLVVIEKLPFASPEDPLVRARIEHLTATGVDAFRHYQLPEAVLALKQGAGRLIRSEEDYGAVVICDPRLAGKSYGRVFIAALPPMSVTRDVDEVRRFLRAHAPRAASWRMSAT
ncbi:MAG TPA: ATP-dependent DNA helicase [Steroidobacteraceae bacterium]|nr:ATP-dependent DNA helicase [Steroidobacteraceae bacterium]